MPRQESQADGRTERVNRDSSSYLSRLARLRLETADSGPIAAFRRRWPGLVFVSAAVVLSASVTWLVACGSWTSEQWSSEMAQSVCDRVDSISQGMLEERLTEDEIERELDVISVELQQTRGELEDAVWRFDRALRNILASNTYDYPTLQPLSYLDTYEHMEINVDGYESVKQVRAECALLGKEWIGDRPAITSHVSQLGIERGKYTVSELEQLGRELFTASFNTLDGAGRPTLTGDGEFRDRRVAPDNFNRISGPDANSCAGCHAVPRIGGGGDNVANVFALADRFDFVDFEDQLHLDHRSEVEELQDPGPQYPEPLTLENVGNERNTVGMFGSGFVELLAREMTRDLQAIEREAIAEARETGKIVRKPLMTKGVDFGVIAAHPRGFTYTTEVEGVDGDLIVRPFIAKGVVTSLREFTNTALIQHHGVVSYELAGPHVDLDGDGVIHELTPGDVTALVAFQAKLPPPVERLPSSQALASVVERGREQFGAIGCTSCHVPALPLESLVFTEPNEFNLGRDLRPGSVERVLEIDLSELAGGFERDEEGRYLIPVYSDLRRHEMGDTLDDEEVIQAGVPTDQWMTRRLWGFVSEPPFLHNGRALLISEAIIAHGGEAEPSKIRFLTLSQDDQDAIVEFLQTLQIPE